MEKRPWLAWTIIAGWAMQLFMLWPLPQAIANSWDLPPSLAMDAEQRLWLGWVLRAVLAVMGVLSGLMLLKHTRNWSLVFLASSTAYVFFYSQWIPFYSRALRSWSSIVSTASWIWMHPGFLFMTLVFPIFLVAVSIYALLDLARRGNRHAI